jgi:hypothetical protein
MNPSLSCGSGVGSACCISGGGGGRGGNSGAAGRTVCLCGRIARTPRYLQGLIYWPTSRYGDWAA